MSAGQLDRDISDSLRALLLGQKIYKEHTARQQEHLAKQVVTKTKHLDWDTQMRIPKDSLLLCLVCFCIRTRDHEGGSDKTLGKDDSCESPGAFPSYQDTEGMHETIIVNSRIRRPWSLRKGTGV